MYYTIIIVIFSIPTTGNVPEGRTWHSLSAASDKHLFLYGGFNNDEEALGTILTLLKLNSKLEIKTLEIHQDNNNIDDCLI